MPALAPVLNVVVFSDAPVGISVALELSTMVIDSVVEAVVLVVLVSELAGLVDDSVGREEEDIDDDTEDTGEDDCCDDDDEGVTTSMNRVRRSSHVAVGVGLEGSTENRAVATIRRLVFGNIGTRNQVRSASRSTFSAPSHRPKSV